MEKKNRNFRWFQVDRRSTCHRRPYTCKKMKILGRMSAPTLSGQRALSSLVPHPEYLVLAPFTFVLYVATKNVRTVTVTQQIPGSCSVFTFLNDLLVIHDTSKKSLLGFVIGWEFFSNNGIATLQFFERKTVFPSSGMSREIVTRHLRLHFFPLRETAYMTDMKHQFPNYFIINECPYSITLKKKKIITAFVDKYTGNYLKNCWSYIDRLLLRSRINYTNVCLGID